ncbi:hypothetical protein [Serratia fonticola]
MDDKLLLKWLENTNDKYRKADIPPRQRPMKAMLEFSVEFKVYVVLGSDLAKKIDHFFESNSKPGEHSMGSLFTGCYYFDSTFWPLNIPSFFGEVSLSPFDCLDDMPESLKIKIEEDNELFNSLLFYWSDCLDYILGYETISSSVNLEPKALVFFKNAHRELIGAISQILLPKPNTKAILSLRLATEIFMKACLVQELKLGDKELMKLSHKLEDIAAECYKTTSEKKYLDVSNDMSIFPNISYRYDGHESKYSEVWKALCLTQKVASIFTRRYSPHDILAQKVPNINT